MISVTIMMLISMGIVGIAIGGMESMAMGYIY